MSAIYILCVVINIRLSHSDETGEFCGPEFTTQSPINIKTSQAKTCPSRSNLLWFLGNHIPRFSAVNTGHYITVFPIGSDEGTLQNNFVTASGEHRAYCLEQFHMHWGQQDDVGSEHTINGESTVLEMHFVHYSCDYANYAEAIAANPTDPYVLAVVGVFYRIGEYNPFLQRITDEIESVKYYKDSFEIDSNGEDINMNQLVPVLSESNSYPNRGEFYHYLGGLTTSPCSPIVSWHVLEEQKTLSRSQLTKLRECVFDKSRNLTVPNFREVQTNTNDVFSCPKETKKKKKSDSDSRSSESFELFGENEDMIANKEEVDMVLWMKTSLLGIWAFAVAAIFFVLLAICLCYYIRKGRQMANEEEENLGFTVDFNQ